LGTTFKAAVLTKINSPLEILELKFPKLKSGQVLIQNRFSGICRSQIMEVSGQRGEDKWLPHLLGHEGFGIVREIGPEVKKVSPGQKVVISWIKGSGMDALNPLFTTSERFAVHSGPATTFSEFSVVSENRVFKSPVNFPEEFIPQFGCAFITGGGMVLSNLKTQSMEKKQLGLVLGFGGVGTAAALLLKSFKNFEVVIIEESKARQESAKELGFTHVYSHLAQYRKNNIDKLFDYCFESAGSVISIQEGFESIKHDGTIIFASHPKSGDLISIDPYELIKGKTIKGTWGGNLPPDSAIIEISDRLHDTKVNFNSLIGPKFTLENVNQGLLYLKNAGPGKPLIDFGDKNW
jgi:S-(hydroxymethyl)glutathione dehydrogenase/alcohol dehydrogenase